MLTNQIKKKKVAKKKKPLQVKNFFPTLKNSQGFPKHLCCYEESIKDYVFVPKNYGTSIAKWRNNEFCCCCKLKPCITVEYFDLIQHKCFEEHHAMDQAREEGRKIKDLTVINRLQRMIMNLLKKHFGRDYVNEVGVPECVFKETQEYNLRWHRGKQEE